MCEQNNIKITQKNEDKNEKKGTERAETSLNKNVKCKKSQEKEKNDKLKREDNNTKKQ